MIADRCIIYFALGWIPVLGHHARQDNVPRRGLRYAGLHHPGPGRLSCISLVEILRSQRRFGRFITFRHEALFTGKDRKENAFNAGDDGLPDKRV